MQSHSMRWRFVLLLAVFALVAAACGGSDDATDETTTTAAAETTTTAAPTTDETTTTAAPAEPVEPPTAEYQLAGLTVVDENTFTAELVEADPEFPVQLGHQAYFALPSIAYENTYSFNEAPIGNGPFMMEGSWEHDVGITVVKNPDYAGEVVPSIDKIEFQIIADSGTAYNEALAGNLDVLTNIPSDNLAIAPTDFPDRFLKSPTTSFMYLGIPTYLPEFTEGHRQALSMAMDRDLLVEKIWAGSGTAAHGVIPPTLQGRDYVCPSWEFDPDLAKETWDAAQAAAPIEDFSVWFNLGSTHEVWIEAVVNMWGQYLGIDTSSVAFEGREWADYLELLNNREVTGPFRLGWGQDYPSPLNFLEPLYASYSTPDLGGYNNAFYEIEEFDAALAAGKAKIAASGELADGLDDYYAAEDILCEDGNIIPVRYGVNQIVHSEDVSDVYMNSFSRVGYDVIKSQDGTVSQDLHEPESLLTVDNNESEGGQVLTGVLYTGLVAFDPTNNEPYNAHAESVTSEDGGVTWTITLKPGWTFHNGEPVTAQSYVDAWSYGAREALGLRNTSFYVKFAGYKELNG